MGQHEFIMRRTDSNELGPEEENKEALDELEDLTYHYHIIHYNADLFIANQDEVNTKVILILILILTIRWNRQMFILV